MNKKILIVDDEELIRKFLVRKLVKMGYEVQSAEDGMEAVEAAKVFKPDLILMDIAMPVMSGSDAIRLIREEEDIKDTSIIAISAKAFPEELKDGLDAGANLYLTKPIKFHEIMEAVNRFVV
jgi:Response regulators consisting of a CheY-like receiver domain and a winged-helix DNA-binding domain